jgi:hypothetical protein
VHQVGCKLSILYHDARSKIHQNILEYFSNIQQHPLEFYGSNVIDDDRLLMLVELPNLQGLSVAFSYPFLLIQANSVPSL